jgi:hypothetical protein
VTKLLRRFGLAALLVLAVIGFWPAETAAHGGHHASHHGNDAAPGAEAMPQFVASAVPRSEVPHCPRGKSPAQHAGCCAHQSCPAGSALVPAPLMMGGAVPLTPEQGRVASLRGLPARPGKHPPKS